MSLIDTDWGAEWIRLHEERGRPDDAACWDERAVDFVPPLGTSAYASTFIEYMQIRAGESVLDMGCGSGALALPLARQEHRVCAVDFSQAMLAQLVRQAAQEGLHNITTVKASWEDDWRTAGVPVADVAVASRSISVRDLGSALRKLNCHGRRRVCLTVAAGASPGDVIAREAVGRKIRERHDYIYCLLILYQMGIRPEVRFIAHEQGRAYASREQARRSFRSMIGPIDEREEKLLERFLEEHLVSTADKNGDIVWRQDKDRMMEWAFMAWDKARTPQPR